ncbi:DUF503 domain-containing protein [Bacillus daqingensis]|uniref:DUF503 domain-containing protein n=1 Tax=Bacillus daqingensis TaxID=872396 RepID=A0ABV9NQR7_9BACI
MIGAVTIEALLYDPQSLKEKRAVTKSCADYIRRKFNAAFAETEHQDVWQRVKWVAVSVSSNRAVVEKELQRVLHYLDSRPELEISSVTWEWL